MTSGGNNCNDVPALLLLCYLLHMPVVLRNNEISCRVHDSVFCNNQLPERAPLRGAGPWHCATVPPNKDGPACICSRNQAKIINFYINIVLVKYVDLLYGEVETPQKALRAWDIC